MFINKKIVKGLFLCLALISLYANATKLEADPLEIQTSQNIKVYAFEQVLNRWGDDQWFYFNDLIKRESNWRNDLTNPNSTAFGEGQFLNSTWGLVGCKKTLNAYTQIDCTIKYIVLIYGTPQKAIKFHNAHNFY